ncbi:helix-turn-helix domain-containing protein [Bacteroides bouchesdurhonensis]|uniref:helix-turn-helix domain-containing protein n=1 Tax=Bacteroides bouchesdurhonensis TaxID=1841855 RepID=UPI0011DE36D7|nr:helix-turn-helix domain-containing protein [Bacteroides bouchesdurhonensis]
MRFIELEDSEKEELVRRYANHKNATVRKRVQALILSSQYYSMKEIIEATGMSRTTLYRFFKEWENTELSERIDTLFIKDGRGAKPKLYSIIEELLNLVERYNGKVSIILRVLEENYGIIVSRPTLQKYLKKL